jgi:transcriptional regulator with XRE-family HTH domain
VERTASEFLRAIRGERSQVAFSRRLGYRGNPITDWERGARFPTAEEALRAAARANLGVEAAFARFSPQISLTRSGRGFALHQWLTDLKGAATIGEVATRCGASRYSVSRWLHGQAKPRLPDFMRLVDAITGRLPHWVSAFVPIERVPSLEERFRVSEAARLIAFELPWTEAVLRVLETRSYLELDRHEEGFVARVLGISRDEEHRCLQALVDSNAVALVDGRYVVRGATTVDTQGGAALSHRLKRHWCQVASDRLAVPCDGELFAYNVVSVSRADLRVIQERLRSAFRDIRSIVAASKPEEAAAVINLHLVTFDPGVSRGERR